MMHRKVLLLCCFFVFLFGCQSENIPEEKYSQLLSIDTESIDSLSLKDFVGEIEFILLETNSDALIDHIDKIKVAADKVFILDKKQKAIFVFDHSGKFLSKIAKPGKAEGEYFKIDDFEIDDAGKNIYILDMISKRILKYNVNGDFLNHHNLSFYADNFYKQRNGYVFSLSGNSCNDGFCEKVIFSDANFNISETFVPVKSNLKNYHIEMPTSRIIKVSENFVRYVDINDMVYSFVDGELKDVKRVDFLDENLNLSFYEQSFKSSGEFLSKIIDQDNAIWLQNYLENNMFIFFKYFLDRKTYSYIYSKKSNNGMVLRNKKSSFISYAPLMINNETFYEVKNITDVFQKERKPLSSTDSLLYEKLKEEHPTINEDSNPLIVKYSIEL